MRAILLVVHVLSALWATVAFAASAGYAQLALHRPDAEEVARYFEGGPGLASRGALGVLGVSGVALVAVGVARPSALWVQVGMSMWALVATTAGVGMWPAERRLQAGQGSSGTGWSALVHYRSLTAGTQAAPLAVTSLGIVLPRSPPPGFRAGLRRRRVRQDGQRPRIPTPEGGANDLVGPAADRGQLCWKMRRRIVDDGRFPSDDELAGE